MGVLNKIVWQLGLLNFFRKVWARFFAVADWCVPKRKDAIFFASGHGFSYAGNSRFLYEYTRRCHPEWDCRFYLRKQNHSKIPEGGLVEGWKACWFFLRSEVLFFTHAPDDFRPYFPSRRKKMIDLWHGVPMRGICLMDRRWAKTKRIRAAHQIGKCSQVVMPSKEAALRWASCFKFDLDKVLYAGQPRNDFLLQTQAPELPETVMEHLNRAKYTILYAPTWRPEEPTRWFPFEEFDLEALNQFLERQDMMLLLRQHPTDQSDISGYLSQRVISFGPEVLGDINLALPYIDGLVTDYSSLYYDYLLLDRPLIFLHYDYDYYNEYYGFLFDDPDFWFPGQRPGSYEGFLESLQQVPSGDRVYEKQRQQVNHLINTEQTENSGEQIVKQLRSWGVLP